MITFALAIGEKSRLPPLNGVLVQLVRIHACHAWGHGFESRTHRKAAQEIERPYFFQVHHTKKSSRALIIRSGLWNLVHKKMFSCLRTAAAPFHSRAYHLPLIWLVQCIDFSTYLMWRPHAALFCSSLFKKKQTVLYPYKVRVGIGDITPSTISSHILCGPQSHHWA